MYDGTCNNRQQRVGVPEVWSLTALTIQNDYGRDVWGFFLGSTYTSKFFSHTFLSAHPRVSSEGRTTNAALVCAYLLKIVTIADRIVAHAYRYTTLFSYPTRDSSACTE